MPNGSDTSYGSGRFAHQNVDFKTNNASSGNTSYEKPKNIINAVSEIQRYHVIESRSDEIPKEYFTIEQVLDFFKIGFKSGILESMIFVTIFPFLQTIYPSFKFYFLDSTMSEQEKLFFNIGSYLPILITTLFMVYLSKYYDGKLTRRAIFSLINGRSASFLLKGAGIYFLLKYIQSLSIKEPNFIYSWIDFTKWVFNIFLSEKISDSLLYGYYYKFIIPALGDTANEILFSMIIFALFPYLTVFYKGYMRKRDKYKMKMDYENY